MTEEYEQKKRDIAQKIDDAVTGRDEAEQLYESLRENLKELLEKRQQVKDQLAEEEALVSDLRNRRTFLYQEQAQCKNGPDDYYDEEYQYAQSLLQKNNKKK